MTFFWFSGSVNNINNIFLFSRVSIYSILFPLPTLLPHWSTYSTLINKSLKMSLKLAVWKSHFRLASATPTGLHLTIFHGTCCALIKSLHDTVKSSPKRLMGPKYQPHTVALRATLKIMNYTAEWWTFKTIIMRWSFTHQRNGFFMAVK